ncbi:hypothetical protein NEUTE1DRAFT_119330 [Neurospora tetrasperma FGSC 2508]|uniref:Uncharacterized protein n=1 Tax=Neurospora tetrasperma (strain FGSC 2508 / ATCC MYA-4615 / P0657) TaxID=510951 RepID=F8N0I7_NEUT8|nr:uncharacterized protein NEUTE1DRAFT_119330 [Neurospora tetrasperma FGSC 2508]EGO53815.1 hypothetical protein NEUTE1DRAFT_119330 [Neurospora tetrasperma FGSC 2508]
MPMIFIFCECTSACNNSHILPTSQSRQQRQGRRHDGRKRKCQAHRNLTLKKGGARTAVEGNLAVSD